VSRARRSALAALLVLTVLGLLWPSERTTLEANSFGTVPSGQRALFELLTELGLPVARSYDPPDALGPEAVVWWIEPRGLCEGEADAAGQGSGAEPQPAWDPRPWLQAGGTAVVFLPARPSLSLGDARPRLVEDSRCERLGPFALPPRDEIAAREAQTGEPGADTAGAGVAGEPESEEPEGRLRDWLDGELGEDSSPVHAQILEGGRLRRPRSLNGPRLRRFRSAGDFEVGAWLIQAPDPHSPGAGGPTGVPSREPFVLERAVGAGRLVVVADGSILSNRWLDREDAAPLALDLVRGFGVPALDEREHGLRREQRPLVYLAGSPALGVFAGLALLGLLALWRGAALPRRAIVEVDPSAPELERFVDSLASLYARSRDYARVAQRYRGLSLARVRRHFGLAPEISDAALLARLRGEGRLAPADLAAFDPEAMVPVRSAADLRAAARRLDSLVKEACR
jgi:hypothetical protein